MILGIDLGTTNSLASLWKDGKVTLVPNALGEYLTPSCVGLDEDGSIVVGRAAKERLQTHPDKTASLFKRYMGSARTIKLAGKEYRPEELSSLVLRSLKQDAEALLGYRIEEAVITVPAYFSDSQRKATRDAGRLAGLRVDRLLSEPTAAALAYGLHEAGDESKFLIFDLGGGTFDVSIIEKFEGVMEVRASAGDNFLGGEDFTQVIVDHFLATSGIPADASRDAAFLQQLVARAERVKQSIGSLNATVLAANWDAREYSIALTEDQFAGLGQKIMDRLRVPVERALRDARLRAGDIDHVVLAGGATRMPLVRQLATRMFGRFPYTEINPDEVVVAGAAIMAGLKMKDVALSEITMTDVSPYTLGINVTQDMPDGTEVHGLSSPIIERNTIIPASRLKTYWPSRDHQEFVVIGVYQGEARFVKDNIKLGELRMDLPRLPIRESAFDVRFTYDVNGLLEVDARLQKTGESRRLVIQNTGETLSPEEIELRLAALADLKIHPRDKQENRALLAWAERLFEQMLGNQREQLGMEIMRFETILKSQDEQVCLKARVRLQRALEAFESGQWFAPDFED